MLQPHNIRETCEQIDNLKGVTEADAISFILYVQGHPANAGLTKIPIQEFLLPGDFANYFRAKDFWPLDAPATAAMPTLSSILFEAVQPQPEALGPLPYKVTFASALAGHWDRCHRWLLSQGRDPNNPRVTTSTKRAKALRDAAARRRAETSEDEEQRGAALAAKAAWKEYNDYRKKVKAEVKELEASHAPKLEELWLAFQALKDAVPLGKKKPDETL